MKMIADQAKALVLSAKDSPKKPANLKSRDIINAERLTPSECFEAVSRVVSAYPNGGRDAGRDYISALARTLANYPRSVALACADPQKGIIRTAHFMPTVADIVDWCETEMDKLWRAGDRERRIEAQLAERKSAIITKEESARRTEFLKKLGVGPFRESSKRGQ